MSIALSFDIGHSSIGWAALKPDKDKSEILGCGTVVFPKEDCQNQQRAGFRRQRRQIGIKAKHYAAYSLSNQNVACLRIGIKAKLIMPRHRFRWGWALVTTYRISG